MVNKKLGKRLMAAVLSAMLLVPAPAVSAAEPSSGGQLEELSGKDQPAAIGQQDQGQEEGAAGDQGNRTEGLSSDASAGNQEDAAEGILRDVGSRANVPDNSGETAEGSSQGGEGNGGTTEEGGNGGTTGGGSTEGGGSGGTTEDGSTEGGGSGTEEGGSGGTTGGGSGDGSTEGSQPGETQEFTVDESGVLTAYNGAGGEITIPAEVGGVTVTGIGKDIFDGTKDTLTKVTISENITEVTRFLFQDCANLEEVILPETLTGIGDYSFTGCGKLAKVEFPENLKSIGTSAFEGCTGLKSISFPSGVTDVSERAFKSCTALESISTQGTKVCRLNQYAFEGCTSLASVELSAGAEVLRGAFRGCTSLTGFKVAEGSAYDVVDGCLYESGNKAVADGDRTALVVCPAGKTEVTFLEGITAIGEQAFAGCTGLTSVEIPDTVTEIGMNAFDGCSGLTKAVLPKNLSMVQLGLFQDSGLTAIEIPETVTRIREYAFAGCQGLNTVTIPGTVSVIAQSAFSSCRNLESVYLQEGVETIETWAFAGCESLKVLVVPKSVTMMDFMIPSGESHENLTIYGEAGSAAETYAKENGIKFSTGQPGDEEPEEEIYDISNEAFTVTLEQEVYDYDGERKRPVVTIKKGETELMPGADFTVDYENYIGPGTAKAIIKGYGKYSGEVVKEFTIRGIDISGEGFTVTLSESKYIYDGTAKEPAVTITKGTETLPGTGYSVSYENNINPGTAKAIVTGKGIYAGTVTREFTIEKAPEDISDPSFSITLSEDSFAYDGKEKRPAVTVKKGETGLMGGTDFTVTYENNTNPGTAKAIVKGRGDYSGEVAKEFTIKKIDISGPGFTVSLSESKYTYDGKAKEPAVTVSKGTVTLRGTDFTVKYENNTEPGTAKAIVTGAGVYTGTVTKEFTISPAEKDGTDGQEKKPVGLTCKKVFEKKYGDKAFSLKAKAVKGAKITYKSSNKKVADVDRKGKVTVKGTGITTITIKATASGYEAQTLKVTVKVSPSKASAPSLKTLRGRKLKVSWKRDKRATGYQIQYCTSKTFKKGVKTITVAKNKTVTKTIPKLTRGKRYYVRVRAYKSAKLNKKTQKLYGAWSAAKRSGRILR